ncbi:MAG: polyamine aminopropyltransferase [Alphaproteobacteria bacterium]
MTGSQGTTKTLQPQSADAIRPGPGTEDAAYRDLPRSKAVILLLSIAVVALCGIVYELIIGTVSSYLLGNSVYQFSLTIGFFMFAMGIGSYLSKFIGGRLLERFILAEIVLALIGGICSLSLFMTFPLAPAFYQTVMFAFIFSIGALVGLEIPLLTRVLAAAGGTRTSIANVMSLDYVGALVGSVAFPLLLLPGLGLIRSSFAIGVANIFVALLNVIWLRDHLSRPRAMMAGVGAVAVLLVALTVFGSHITAYAQHHLYFDTVVWEKQTPYQTLVVTRNSQRNDLRLFIDGHIQFSSEDEHRYHEALVHPAMMSSSTPPRAVLVLGGGDGLAIREILKYDTVERIDLVDLDPAMTWLGARFAPLARLNENALDDPRVRIFNVDAFVFIKDDGPTYDRVIMDFPDPHNEAIAKLYSAEFYAMVARRLAPGGVVATQSSSPFFARNAFWSVRATLARVFPQSASYQVTVPSFGLWGFHLASQDPLQPVTRVPVPTRYLTAPVFEAAQIFGADADDPGTSVVNSIFEPTLYEIYIEDLRGAS